MAKAGHTGSLDPLATGVLPLCFGEATKFSHYLLNADKRYQVTLKAGGRTTTGDVDGEVIETFAPLQLTQERVLSALSHFRGEIEQIPSMYSALKHQGKATLRAGPCRHRGRTAATAGDHPCARTAAAGRG